MPACRMCGRHWRGSGVPCDPVGPTTATNEPRSRWQISAVGYRRVCVAALVMLCVIIVSGVAVRLTGSGLGCDDWPACNDERLIDVSSRHAAIEQVNRLFTGLVSAAVVLAVLGSLRRVPRRSDLTLLSLGLVVGVLAQIVLGGVTVLVDLHPAAVQGHLVVSMVLVANAVVLVYRSGLNDGPRVRVTAPNIGRHLWWCAATTAIAIVAGTVVTGAGPHAGDERARRFAVSIGAAARVHSIAVWIAVACVAALLLRLRSRPSDRAVLEAPLTIWVGAAFVQGGIGYLQYFSGVPEGLVFAHVAGATALWAATVWMVEAQWTDRPEPADPMSGQSAAQSAEEPLGELGGLVDHG